MSFLCLYLCLHGRFRGASTEVRLGACAAGITPQEANPLKPTTLPSVADSRVGTLLSLLSREEPFPCGCCKTRKENHLIF